MKCKGIEDPVYCFDCPYADCLVDLKGNLPSDEEQIECILSLKRREKYRRYYYRHKDEILERQKNEREKARVIEARYRKRHKKQIAQRCKAYREKNKEKVKETKRVWREAHKEQEAARQRRYYAEHREQILARRRECARMKKNQDV